MARVWYPGDGQDDSDLPDYLREDWFRRGIIIVELDPYRYLTIGNYSGDIVLRNFACERHETMVLAVTREEAQAVLEALTIASDRLFRDQR